MADETTTQRAAATVAAPAAPAPRPQPGPRPQTSPRPDRERPAALRGVPTQPLVGRGVPRPGGAPRPGTAPSRPTTGAPRRPQQQQPTAVVQVGTRQAHPADGGTVQIARGALSELGRFIDSQVHAYRMAGEASAREAKTAAELASTRDELVTELRHRIDERQRELEAVTAKLELARAEADTLRMQLATVNDIVSKSTEAQRKRWFGRS